MHVLVALLCILVIALGAFQNRSAAKNADFRDLIAIMVITLLIAVHNTF